MANVKAAGIFVNLAVNMSQMATGFAKAESAVKNFVGGANRTLGTLKNIAATAGIAYGVKETTAALLNMVEGVVKARDEMGDMARMTGVTVRDMSALSHMAGALGMDVNTLASNMTRLSKNVLDASEDSGAAQAAFRTLGISAKDAAGQIRQPMDMLGELNKKFSAMQDGTVKTALAMQLFGKGGAQMLEILNLDREAFEDMYDTLDRLGLLMTEETAARAEHLQLTFYKAKLQVTAIKGEIVTGMMPALQQMANSMTKLSEYHTSWQKLGEIIGWVWKQLLKGVYAGAAGLSMISGFVDGLVILFKSRWNEMLEEIQRMTSKDLSGMMFESWRPDFQFKDVLEEAWRGVNKWHLAYLELDEAAEIPKAKKAISNYIPQVKKAAESIDDWIRREKALQDILERGERQREQDARTRQQILESVVSADIAAVEMQRRLYNMGKADYLTKQIENYDELLTYQEGYLRQVAAMDDEHGQLYMEAQRNIDETRNKLIELRTEQERLGSKGGAVYALKEMVDQYKDRGQQMYDFTRSTFQGMENLLVDFVDTGKLSFKNFADAVIRDMARMVIQIMVLKPLAESLSKTLTGTGAAGSSGVWGLFQGGMNLVSGWLGSLSGAGSMDYYQQNEIATWAMGAKGMALHNGRRLALARGGIVSSPTAFPMSGGLGVMGEAGPEAVMPLSRTKTGELGVKSEGGQSPQYSIVINAVDSQSFMDVCRRNPSAITAVVERALESNQSLRSTIRQTTR